MYSVPVIYLLCIFVLDFVSGAILVIFVCLSLPVSVMLSHHDTPFHPAQVQITDYLESWFNYCRLFDALLDCRDTNLVISEGWAFDLIHEFVYQFQSFCQMRGQVCVCVCVLTV